MKTAFAAELTPEAAWRQATELLREGGIDNARREARLLAEHALGLSASEIALGRSAEIGAGGAEALAETVARRLAGEPVARILGAWEFWGLPFLLSPGTLVPRPDTETLVEATLARVSDRSRALRLLDLGTGSGCILVALLSELPNAFGIGVDRSPDALRTAKRNAQANGVGDRAGFVLGDWCASFAGPFDLVVSNPPYIASGTIPGLAREVCEHDPAAALDGGLDGLDAYRAILAGLAQRPTLLAPDAFVGFEIGYDQAEAVLHLGTRTGFSDGVISRDLAGNDRVVTLRPPFSARRDGISAGDD